MAFNNRNNLSNESAPWGREVEQKIESNAYDLNQLRLLTENNNKATNGTLGALTRQQDSIIATQEGLLSAQSVLEAQQADILDLRATRTVIAFASDATSTSMFGPVSPVQVTIPFPSWATSAIATTVVYGKQAAASNPNVVVSASVYGSDLAGVGTIPASQTVNGYTQGYRDPALSTGDFSSTAVLVHVINKSSTDLAVSARGTWAQSSAASTLLRISLSVLFTSQ